MVLVPERGNTDLKVAVLRELPRFRKAAQLWLIAYFLREVEVS